MQGVPFIDDYIATSEPVSASLNRCHCAATPSPWLHLCWYSSGSCKKPGRDTAQKLTDHDVPLTAVSLFALVKMLSFGAIFKTFT